MYYSSSMVQRARAPKIVKKYPSLSDLTQNQTNQPNRLRAFDLSKTFKRSNSCIAIGDKMNQNFFDYCIAHRKECDKLYDLSFSPAEGKGKVKAYNLGFQCEFCTAGIFLSGQERIR